MEVAFRKFKEGDIVAIFVNDSYGVDTVESYQHIGQHGGMCADLIHELDDIKYYEYQNLLKELVEIGYKDLEIISEQTIQCHRNPTQGEINFGHGAIHYRDFNIADVINNKTGDLKQWFKADDGLRYYR